MFTNIENPTAASTGTTSTTSIVGTYSMAEFFKQAGIIQVNPKVNANKNGYPFITFIDGDNKAENVYFSKSLAPSFPKDTAIVKGFFDDIQILNLKYEDGETRLKLSSKGGNRLDAMALL
tara:strand:- start:8325 stop:8684 length:360 start_codon:yes stop_codon:yes gene_type:complete